MNKFLFLVVFIVIVVVTFSFLSNTQNMVVIKEGNHEAKPLNVVLGKYQDSDCGMIIDDLTYVSQVVSPKGRTWFFHDHGGMVHWIKDKPFKDSATIWVMSKDTNKYIDGKKAFYSRTDNTPMGYGFGAYEKNQEGFIDYNTMFLHMVRGEDLNNPKIRALLLNGK
ncbi:MAG TPA: hypothetical protein ENK66_04040 [Arcobacter sp.]|nr:hypothetical protein [Arcobacter sp.]